MNDTRSDCDLSNRGSAAVQRNCNFWTDPLTAAYDNDQAAKTQDRMVVAIPSKQEQHLSYLWPRKRLPLGVLVDTWLNVGVLDAGTADSDSRISFRQCLAAPMRRLSPRGILTKLFQTKKQRCNGRHRFRHDLMAEAKRWYQNAEDI